ncbi:TPA: HNH endonuclease [Streptococcus suis]
MKKLELSNKIKVKRLIDITFPKRKSTGKNNNQKFFTVGKNSLARELSKWEVLYINKANENKLYELSYEISKELHVKGVSFDKNYLEKLYNGNQKRIKKFLPRIKNYKRTRYICPICEDVMDYSELTSDGGRLNETIEHILPKSKAPHFIVTPSNLVITCTKCNTNDHQNISNLKINSEINPYFDYFDIRKYLEVKLTLEKNLLKPEIVFKNCFEGRNFQIKNFIIIYNLLNSYTIQVTNAYYDILGQIKQQGIKDLDGLVILIESVKKSYRESYETDGEWIHNNYFGYVLSEKLLNQVSDIYSVIVQQAISL